MAEEPTGLSRDDISRDHPELLSFCGGKVRRGGATVVDAAELTVMRLPETIACQRDPSVGTPPLVEGVQAKRPDATAKGAVLPSLAEDLGVCAGFR